MSDIKTKDKAQRKEYIEKLMNDDTLLKAAMWMLVVRYGPFKILTEKEKQIADRYPNGFKDYYDTKLHIHRWHYCHGKRDKQPGPDFDESFGNLRSLSDYHGIDIINNPELYDTEVKPELLKMCDLLDSKVYFDCFNKQHKILNRDDLIGSFKEFMKNRKLRSAKGLKLYILERSYRAYAEANKLEIEAIDNDFRYDKNFKI